MKAGDWSVYATKPRVLCAVIVPAAVLWLIIFSGLLDDLPRKGLLAGLWWMGYFLALAYASFGGEAAIAYVKNRKWIWAALGIWNLSFVVALMP